MTVFYCYLYDPWRRWIFSKPKGISLSYPTSGDTKQIFTNLLPVLIFGVLVLSLITVNIVLLVSDSGIFFSQCIYFTLAPFLLDFSSHALTGNFSCLLSLTQELK